MVSRWHSSGIFSQDSIRCSSVKKSKIYCTNREKHQKISQEESYLFRWRRMSCKCSIRIFVLQEDLGKDNGHSLVLVLRRSVLYQRRQSTKNLGQNCRKNVFGIRWERMSNFSVLQVHCQEVNSEAEFVENCRYTLLSLRKRLRLFFA